MTDSPSDRTDSPKRLLSARVPLWALLAAVAVVAVTLGGIALAQRMGAVSLGPAVAGAQEVEVRVVICNAEVDRRELNPRKAELDLEETLTDHGADTARVRVERVDCPAPPTG